MKINCFCENKGWLFEDLKNYFIKHEISVSEKPKLDSDAYICIRTNEVHKLDIINKSIVQVHGMYDYDIDFFQNALGIMFTHPMQYWLWKNKGFNGNFKIIPIGCRKEIKPFNTIPTNPTVGFFCGETSKFEKQSFLFKEIILECKKVINFNVLLIGRNLHHISDIGIYEERAATINDYSKIDLLVTTSISPGIPISVYEACAAGKPVVTTPRWFPIHHWPNVKIGNSKDELVFYIIDILNNRHEFHNQRNLNSFSPYTIDNWVTENINFIRELKNASS
jgi:hypothetical protein